jgi:hypothetical protein
MTNKFRVDKGFPAGGRMYRRGQILSEDEMVTRRKGKAPVPWPNTAALINSGILKPVYEAPEEVKEDGPTKS